MRLVIREYLSMLKESGELDVLLPSLLLSMGIEPLRRPQKGVRQHGVDLAAAGADPKDGETRLFLFVIKSGDLDRSSWDAPKQGVRTSLNEVMDAYLNSCIDPDYDSTPKKIIVCSGGELKQDVEQSWAGFKKRHTLSGQLDFDYWGADRLSEYVERYLLDEYLFTDVAHKRLRKALALCGEPDYDLRDYRDFVEDVLFGQKFPKGRSKSARDRRLRAMRLLNLGLHIFVHWAGEEGNLRHAYLAAEHALLRLWDWIDRYGLSQNRKALDEFARAYEVFNRVGAAYFGRLQPLVYRRDGLSGYPEDEICLPLRVFELIGILGVLGLNQITAHVTDGDPDHARALQVIADAVAALVRNNTVSYSPRFDGNMIDICLGLLVLYYGNRKAEAAAWIDMMRLHVCFAYALGKHFPIDTDSEDDLILVEAGEGPAKEKLMQLSTLLPMLAQWCCVLNEPDVYLRLRIDVEQLFPDTNLQLWYPDERAEKLLFSTKAANESGCTLSSIRLPERLEEVADQIRAGRAEVPRPADGAPPLFTLMACRHFRTPIPPRFWQDLVADSHPVPSDANGQERAR